MTRGMIKCIGGGLVLIALAGCGRAILDFAEREPWRREAEARCLQSSDVRERAGRVRIKPIQGPGVCGADFPLKVASLGEMRQALGFAGEPMRPPASIPNTGRTVPPPRWPIAQPDTVPRTMPPPAAMPSQHSGGAPLALHPQGSAPAISAPQTVAPHSDTVPPRGAEPDGAPYTVVRTRRTMPDDARSGGGFREMPRQSSQPSYNPEPLPALGPPRRQMAMVAPVEVKPAATLACPVVSALDRWMADAVQPAAHKWFGQPVAEIRQISAYSCRGMNGQRGARISEHSFGNALDIAAFVLADGRRITVKNGWRGAAEEQGFLRDVQGAACDHFTTVLAPGSNRFHYDHFHVDLMRRASGRRICNPRAVDGEVVAAKARGGAAAVAQARMRDPGGITGSIGRRANAANTSTADEDDDWVEHDGPRGKAD